MSRYPVCRGPLIAALPFDFWYGIAAARRSELAPRLPLRLCDACRWKRLPDAGWCYMFRDEPRSSYCAQFLAVDA